MLGAGEILVQTVISRGQPQAGEHFWTVVLLAATTTLVMVKLALQRALAVGWRRDRNQKLVLDKDALACYALSLAAGLSIGGGIIGAVAFRSGAGLGLSIAIGGAIAVASLFFLLIRLMSEE
jgi:hypothetical protein